MKKHAGSQAVPSADTATAQASMAAIPTPVVGTKPAPGQTGPRGMSPRSNYSRVNSGASTTADLGASAQKSVAPDSQSFLPPKISHIEVPMEVTTRMTIHEMIKAASAGAMDRVAVSMEAERQLSPQAATTKTASAAGPESIPTAYVEKFASAVEYILKEAEEPGPGAGPNHLDVSESMGGTNPFQPGNQGSATPANQPPKNPGLHKPSETPHGPANALDDNSNMSHAAQKHASASVTVADMRKAASVASLAAKGKELASSAKGHGKAIAAGAKDLASRGKANAASLAAGAKDLASRGKANAASLAAGAKDLASRGKANAASHGKTIAEGSNKALHRGQELLSGSRAKALHTNAVMFGGQMGKDISEAARSEKNKVNLARGAAGAVGAGLGGAAALSLKKKEAAAIGEILNKGRAAASGAGASLMGHGKNLAAGAKDLAQRGGESAGKSLHRGQELLSGSRAKALHTNAGMVGGQMAKDISEIANKEQHSVNLARGVAGGAAGLGLGGAALAAHHSSKTASDTNALVDYIRSMTKAAEDAIDPAHITAGPAVPPETSESGEPGGEPAGGAPQGPTGLIASNEAAINATRGAAKAPVRAAMKALLSEPALSSEHDKTLNMAFAHTGQAGTKMASVRADAARILLEKMASEAEEDCNKSKTKKKESAGGSFTAPPIGGVANSASGM